MVAVPAATPVTVPVLPTVVTVVAVLLHAPPVVASLNPVVDPAQTIAVPVIVPADGKGLTLTTLIAAAVPQPLVTV